MATSDKTVTVTCPHCGRMTLEVNLKGSTGRGYTRSSCTYCHCTYGITYENDSFATKILSID